MQTYGLNDFGEVLQIPCLFDISSATSLSILLMRPDNVQLTGSGAFFTDGTDGIVKFAPASGLLSVAGIWQAQAAVTLPGELFHSQPPTPFRVLGDLF